MRRLIPIAEAARSSGRSAAELRGWCATGRLRCELIGTEWHLAEDALHDAVTLQDAGGPHGERAVVSLAFPDENAGRRALDQLREALGGRGSSLRLAPLALDGADLVLLAGSVPVDGLDDVVDVAHRHEGIVVDGVDEARLSHDRRAGASSPGGQSSWG